MTHHLDSPDFRPALALREVGCARGGRRLFGGLSLQLEAGQWLKVSGDNGAGKTSLLRVLGGLLPPDGGQVLWRGQPAEGQRERLALERLWLGHAPAVKDDLSALENLQSACALAGDAVSPDAARAALHEAGLRGDAHRPLRHLSQGQRRRCALARLPLAGHRPLWVLDEPFTALDAAASEWLTRQLRAHLQAGGLAVLTSHQPMALEALPHLELAL